MKKIIIVTGTNSGFGKLTAQTLALKGHKVYATMRYVETRNVESAMALNNWAIEGGYNLKVVDLDLTNEGEVNQLVNDIFTTEGTLDVLINNAGHGSIGITEDFTLEHVRQQFESNVFSVFSITKAVIPLMKQIKSGLIITLTSELGRLVLPTMSVYAASKFAVEALAEGWRYELEPLGIDSVIIEPGHFPTTHFLDAMLAHSPQPSDKIKDYGSLHHFKEGYISSFHEAIKNNTANDPQEVSDVIVSLIETPHGSRPLRTIVDKNFIDILKPINQITDEMESRILNTYQFV